METVQNQEAKLKGKNIYFVPISSNILRALSMEAAMQARGAGGLEARG
jgi:hypothetical protein